MRWSDFTARLTEQDHQRLIIALGAGLAAARQASEVATQNGEVEDARRHVQTAILQLGDVLELLEGA